ncbi:OsmC family protein [Desulfosarcina sp.]|uniref:OsmC family protein n=1 Tax=Desulfosarcina sp. TaxID=2027861 RepID=UPI0039710994
MTHDSKLKILNKLAVAPYPFVPSDPQCRSRLASQYRIGGQSVKKDITIATDEPLELGGTNTHANPQETLMAALNACMTVGYAVGCAMEGIELEELRIETQGDIDLRGFLGLDPNVKPGYDEIHYTAHIMT